MKGVARMLMKFLLILFVLLSFAVFNNVFFPQGIGRQLLDNSSSVFLLIAISVVLFILIMYVLQRATGGISEVIISVLEGIMIGWIVALFAHLKRTRY